MVVERVDFLSIASQDIERSRQFYLETLGLPFDRDVPGGGFEATEKLGLPFAPSPNDLALRVADVAGARAELEGKGVDFRGTHSTPASATWPSSTIRTGTR